MSTTVIRPTALSFPSTQWIIGKRDDLFWFIASALFGYLALVGIAAGFSVLTALIIWNLLIDGPHVFATATRTYLDHESRARLGWRLWSVIPFLLIGPAMWAFGFSHLFLVAVISWAQYHIAKQHFGFIMLYKRKTGEKGDMKLDRSFLLISLMLPWAIFAIAMLMPTRVPGRLFMLFGMGCYGIAAAIYVGHQFNKWKTFQVMNPPKLLLLSIVIPLHWLAFYYAIEKPEGLIIAGIATNVGHSLQYHRLMWFHNRNRYSTQDGFAAILSRSPIIYFGIALLLNVIFSAAPRAAFADNTMLLSSLGGMNMTHYYLDSLIWRTRSDKGLATALRL